MEGKEEVEASLVEHPPTWAQFLSLWLRRSRQVTGAHLPQLPTNWDNKWKETCLHIISLDFAGHLIALYKPLPAIYHLTTVFVICRDFVLGMAPFLCKCDTSKKQGLHMLCPHCLKHFFSTCLGNLSPKYPVCIKNQHVRRKGHLCFNKCEAHTNSHVEYWSPLCISECILGAWEAEWSLCSLSSTISGYSSAVYPGIRHHKSLTTWSCPILYLQDSRPWSKLNSFLYKWPSLGSFVIATQPELQPYSPHGSLVYKKTPDLHHSKGSESHFLFYTSSYFGWLLVFFRCLNAQ